MKLYKKYPFTTFVFLFSLIFFTFKYLAVNVLSATASHIVISEVQIYGASSSEDFIELYNPTDTAIDLTSYRLVKRTSSGATDSNIVSFQSGDIIPAHGFFLWCNSSISESLSCDRSTSQNVSNNNSVGLRDGDTDTGTLVDSVTFGSPSFPLGEMDFIGMGSVQVPGQGESIERKACPDSTFSTMSNGDSSSGNGEDTDNNSSDFVNKLDPEPQNSSSSIEVSSCGGFSSPTPTSQTTPTAEETPTPTIEPTPTDTITPTPTYSPTPTLEPTTTPVIEPTPTETITPTPTETPQPTPTQPGRVIGRFIFPGYVKTCRLTLEVEKYGFFFYAIPLITCD
ncbi:lamin tail domain-containing protein [Candidatus Woesebacteria bacterium]|nr:lamin tail domain-containing protein [Candidatus Woesebacteria bacterium]